jgi:hypothetical protein
VAGDAQQYGISTYAGRAAGSSVGSSQYSHGYPQNLYFVDGNGYNPPAASSVFKIDPSGFITRVAGDSRTSFSGDGATASGTSLTSPRALAVDGAGNVFIVDAGNQRSGASRRTGSSPRSYAEAALSWATADRRRKDGTITTVAGSGAPRCPGLTRIFLWATEGLQSAPLYYR